MHNNYFFLRQLTEKLNERLAGYSVVSCFSQNKDELMLEFNNGRQSFFIKASLQPSFSCLSFPNSFNRARKNSVDLFNSIILKKVRGVRQFKNERCFAVELEDNLSLIFKMHGNRSNVLLAMHDGIIEIFKNQLKGDLSIKPSLLDRTIDWSKEFFLTHSDRIFETYFILGKPVKAYFSEIRFDGLSAEEKWNKLHETKNLLENPSYYIVESERKLAFSLLPFGRAVKKFHDPIGAINEFFYAYTISEAFYREKNSVIRTLATSVSSSESYLEKTKLKLAEVQQDHHYQAWADLLMANLHHIEPGADRIVLENFYNHNHPVEIKLKKELTAQKNAEVLYRKAKNHQIEVGRLKELISLREGQLKKDRELLAQFESISDLKELRAKTESTGLNKRPMLTTEKLPYHEFEFKGFKIWVGRDAQNNDELTLKYAFKEDLWLHAKDVPGSHVVIKWQAGKGYPKDVIERAAQLAAYNSKRKTDSLCPVAFTAKKYVRKRKGDPPGAVVVQREEVILVEPKL